MTKFFLLTENFSFFHTALWYMYNTMWYSMQLIHTITKIPWKQLIVLYTECCFHFHEIFFFIISNTYQITGIFSHAVFGKNFVKWTGSLNKLQKSWFDEKIWWERFSRFSTLCNVLLVSTIWNTWKIYFRCPLRECGTFHDFTKTWK